MKTKKLGDLLIEAGIIDNTQLQAALGHQKQWGGKIGSILMDMGFVDEKSMAYVLEKQLGEKCVSLETMEISPVAVKAIKSELAKKYNVMPLKLEKNTLHLAVLDPTDIATLDEIGFILGLNIKPVLALDSEIKTAIAEYYDGFAYKPKSYRAQIEQLSETMNIIMNEPPRAALESSRSISETKDHHPGAVMDAVVSLLIEKGIFTIEELAKKLKDKK